MERIDFSGQVVFHDNRRQRPHTLLLWAQLSEPRVELSYLIHHDGVPVLHDNRKFLLYQLDFRNVPVGDTGQWNRVLVVEHTEPGLHRVWLSDMAGEQKLVPWLRERSRRGEAGRGMPRPYEGAV